MIKMFVFCLIGSTLEWYDFAVFGVLAPLLSKIFFPKEDKVIALLMTFTIFATGFIMRPLGGIVFGHIGDKYGRKKAIIGSVFLMTIATVCIGLLPVKQLSTSGIIITLLALRLLQGFAVSGEYSGMFTFISEIVPRKYFFFCQSFVCSGATGGILLGTIIGSIALSFYHGSHASFAWRWPFLVSILLGIVGLYLRLKISDSPVFLRLKASKNSIALPIKEVLLHYHRAVIFIILLSMSEAIGCYFAVVYYPAFIHKLNLNVQNYLHIAMVGLILLIVLAPIIGIVADNYNLIKLLVVGMVAYIILPFIVLWWVNYSHGSAALLGTILLFIPIIFLEPLIAPLMALLFPPVVRYTGVSLSINITVCLFSGTSPLIVLGLVKITGLYYAPAFYLGGMAILSLLTLYFKKRIIPLQYHQLTHQVDIN